ncbi:LeuA family protein [Halomarina ordinaria]|uniref:LeuA family protein n=1 Tax=Halomarina ordinaria TaxID=3033939 RepID=A0ABD5U4I8_9EURY|nr:citramalate synthase [Halomarina sp. PSRA2]
MYLCDVTLREGDQMPGRNYTEAQKVAAGRALDRLGVDAIQPGFPVTGEKDVRVTRTLADECEADVVALARAVSGDVDAALDAEADVVEVFGALSSLQLEHALGTDRETMFERFDAAIERVRDGGATPHLTLVDAFRTEREHLVAAFERYPDLPMVTLADTVGVRTPASLRHDLTALGEGVDLARVGVHLHDDLGCATANALVAHEVGVGKADVSVASLGERAGNPAVEEVVIAGVLEYGESFGVTAADLVPACRTVLAALEESVPPRKAILGSEVMEHESGIHTAAMLREPRTFEPFDPGAFGAERRLVFGAGTGRSGARQLLERAGADADEETVAAYLDRLAAEGPLDTEEAVDLARREFAS